MLIRERVYFSLMYCVQYKNLFSPLFFGRQTGRLCIRTCLAPCSDRSSFLFCFLVLINLHDLDNQPSKHPVKERWGREGGGGRGVRKSGLKWVFLTSRLALLPDTWTGNSAATTAQCNIIPACSRCKSYRSDRIRHLSQARSPFSWSELGLFYKLPYSFCTVDK